MILRRADRVELREIVDPVEVVELLRLRHRIYFEEQEYGPSKCLRLDLTAHDRRSRLFGVFQGGQLVGGWRIVLRTEQRLENLFRSLRAVAELEPEPHSRQLPSEEAFDVPLSLGASAELVDAEIGRLTLDTSRVPPWLGFRLIPATLATTRVAGARLYLYSCATSLAKRYARVSNPRFMLDARARPGIASDRFVFPKPTVAAVAAVEDSPYRAVVEHYARQLVERGSVDLGADGPLRGAATASVEDAVSGVVPTLALAEIASAGRARRSGATGSEDA